MAKQERLFNKEQVLTVNVSSLNVRTGPSTSHTVLGSVNKGKTVQVVGEVQDWFKINFNGGTGYVSKDFVTKGGSAVSNETQQPTTTTILQQFKLVVLMLLTLVL